MLTRTTIISWLVTVVIGSLVFSGIENSGSFAYDFEDYFAFGLLSMAVSGILGSPTLVIILVTINVWLNRAMSLKKRLAVMHTVHAVCAVITFVAMVAWQAGEDVRNVAMAYVPTAAAVWAVATYILRKKREFEPVLDLQQS